MEKRLRGGKYATKFITDFFSNILLTMVSYTLHYSVTRKSTLSTSVIASTLI